VTVWTVMDVQMPCFELNTAGAVTSHAWGSPICVLTLFAFAGGTTGSVW